MPADMVEFERELIRMGADLGSDRRWVAPLALMLLCLVSVSAQAQQPGIEAARHLIDAAPRTIQACTAIAALADRGASALHAADLVGRRAPIDLRNDGHPQRINRSDEGTAHFPFLVDEAGNNVAYGNRNDYLDGPGRLAPEIAVVRVAGRVWEVAWAAGELDGNPILQAATDGTAVCQFHVAFRPPVFRMLLAGEPAKADIYRRLLLGRGVAPPSAGLDPKAVDAASGLNRPDTGATYVVQPLSWRVDLLNNRKAVTVIRVWFVSSAGRGCERNMLSLVQGGRITNVDLLPLYGTGWGSDGDTVPLSQAFRRIVRPLSCVSLAETPVLDRDGRAYVLLANDRRVRLLVGSRNGVMQPLARLLWQVHNEVDLPPKP